MAAEASRSVVDDVTVGTFGSHASAAVSSRPPRVARSTAAASDAAVATPTKDPSASSTTIAAQHTAADPPATPPPDSRADFAASRAASAADVADAEEDTLGTSIRIASATRRRARAEDEDAVSAVSAIFAAGTKVSPSSPDPALAYAEMMPVPTTPSDLPSGTSTAV